MGDTTKMNRTPPPFTLGGRFLGKHAIRSSNWTVSEDNITGIDWASSHTSTPFNVEGISVPLLISQHSGHSAEFKSRYFRAQAERMNRLIDDALELLQRIEAGKHIYTDDAPFNIPKFDGARLLSLNTSIRHTTLFPEKLLKNDGSIEVKIIESIAPSRPELREANQKFSEGSREGLTVRSFLSSNAIRGSNSMDETQIDLCSRNNSTPVCFSRSRCPCLPLPTRLPFRTYSYAKSTDKDFIVVEGATTGVTPCTNCANPPTSYDNATKNFFDYAAKWINDRFSSP